MATYWDSARASIERVLEMDAGDAGAMNSRIVRIVESDRPSPSPQRPAAGCDVLRIWARGVDMLVIVSSGS